MNWKVRATKRVMDVISSTIGLAVTLPFYPLIALAIKLDSPGPVFYRQQRAGSSNDPHGNLLATFPIFTLRKFRTMRQNAEVDTGAVLAAQNDPRVTRVGRFLRKTRLDELPQFINVLKGDMSLVGPRPERPELLRVIAEAVPFFEERMRMLDMSHKLKDAELLALQTQINPHFLFNTLSAGMQLALTEDADRTADFLENLSAFMRYVLKPPSRSVWVSDEIECLERYVWLLRLRFGDRYRFEVSADKDVLSVETPALLLQPLVENAVAHGLKDREEGGVVRVTVRKVGSEAILSVEDTGDGMTCEEIHRVMNEDDNLHECGIGLRNVIRRVTLATGGRGHVELESILGRGTEVRIHLPLEGSGQ